MRACPLALIACSCTLRVLTAVRCCTAWAPCRADAQPPGQRVRSPRPGDQQVSDVPESPLLCVCRACCADGHVCSAPNGRPLATSPAERRSLGGAEQWQSGCASWEHGLSGPGEPCSLWRKGVGGAVSKDAPLEESEGWGLWWLLIGWAVAGPGENLPLLRCESELGGPLPGPVVHPWCLHPPPDAVQRACGRPFLRQAAAGSASLGVPEASLRVAAPQADPRSARAEAAFPHRLRPEERCQQPGLSSAAAPAARAARAAPATAPEGLLPNSRPTGAVRP